MRLFFRFGFRTCRVNSPAPNGIARTRLKNSFSDASGDGRIGIKEMSIVMRSLGKNYTEGELRDLLDDVDVDGSGQLDLQEFKNLMTSKLDANPREDLKAAFETLDVDKDGFLSKEDLKKAAQVFDENLSDVELTEIMRELRSQERADRIDMESYLEAMET